MRLDPFSGDVARLKKERAAFRRRIGADMPARKPERVTEPRVNLNARIRRGLIRRIRIRCLEEERLLRDFTVEALREHFARLARR